MKECAIVLNGSDVIAVTNLKRKQKKIENNSNMKILEIIDLKDLDNKLRYWKDKYTIQEDEDSLITLHHFINPNNGCIVTSIYDNLNDADYLKDKDDYIKID